MRLMGIDIGTTGCKVCTFSEHGKLLYRAYREYRILNRAPGLEELDAEYVMKQVKECIRENNLKLQEETAQGISVSVSGDECVFVGNNGETLAPVIMSRDSRGQEELEDIQKVFSQEQLYQLTGLPIHRKYGLFRILWYKKHKKSVYDKVWRFMTWEDFLLFRLGSKDAACSLSSLARLMIIDISRKDFSEEILSAAGISRSAFSKPVPSATSIDTMEESVARELGFRTAPQLITGGFDQACAAFGAGMSKAGTAVVGSGTMESLSCCSSFPMISEKLRAGNYPCNFHVVSDSYLCTATNVGGGSIVKWFRDHIGNTQGKKAEYSELISECTKDPTGLILLPHFAGSGPPSKDADSLGAILGLNLTTDRTKILQGVLEGITYELRQNIELMEEGSCNRIQFLRAVGGGANSEYWLQLKADITGKKIIKMQVEEAGCSAAAMIAAIALGLYHGWDEVSAKFVQEEKVYDPEPERNRAFEPYYQIYKKVYPALCGLLHDIKKLQG